VFSIGPDTRPPVVLDTTPGIVELGTPTNADVSSITVEFSENVIGAGSAASYQLKSAGADGMFDDGGGSDDVLYPLAVLYTPGTSDADTSSALLSILGGPLPEGDYRLTSFSSGISDLAALGLDGNLSGGPSNYVRFFTVDKTSPTVFVPPIVPNPRNSGVSPLSIVFDEVVTGVGLADVRLTLDGGPNLLSGTQAFTTFDGVNWFLADTSGITSREGTYTLELTATDSNIRDLAGNPLVVDINTSWTVDATPPALDIVEVAPDPRATSVNQITINSSEALTNFALSNIHLFRDGTEVTLTAANAPTSSDNITWTVGNLASLTSAEGSYLLKIAVGGTLRDTANNGLAAEVRESWQVMTTPPVADIANVTPDPRTSAVAEIVVSFNVPVVGFDLSDLLMTRGGNNVSLAGLPAPTSLDQMNWHVTGLSALTAANGNYVLSLVAAGSGIQDLAGNALAANASDAWVKDDVPPTVTITPVSPDPTNTSVAYIEFIFSKPVTGVKLINFTLSRNAMPINWTEAQSVTTTDSITWKLNNVGPLTEVDGNYTLTLNPNTNPIEAFPGNPVLVGASESWVLDTILPTVTITDVTPNAAFSATNTVQIVFSEPVTGVDKGDFVFTHRDVIVPLTAGQLLTTVDNQTWTLTNLAPLTGQPGKYELSLQAVGSAIQDAALNGLEVGTFETWRVLIPGDLSADNRVGLRDLGRLGRNLGLTSATPEQGDLNGDTTVGRPDLTTLLSYYGSSLPPLGSGAALPNVAGAAPSSAESLPTESASLAGATQDVYPVDGAFQSMSVNNRDRMHARGSRRFGLVDPGHLAQRDDVLAAFLLNRRSPWTTDEGDPHQATGRREHSGNPAATEEAFAELGAGPLSGRWETGLHRLAKAHRT
jgi:hypothetical protein